MRRADGLFDARATAARTLNDQLDCADAATRTRAIERTLRKVETIEGTSVIDELTSLPAIVPERT